METRAKTDWRLVGLLFTVGLLAAAQFGKVSLTLAETGAVYGRGATSVAFLVSLVSIVGILFGAIAGGLVAALGGGRVLLGALVLGAALSTVEALLPPLPMMTALRVAEGFSHLALVVAAPPLMAAAASDADRPVVMSLWAMFFGVSFALSAMIFPGILAAGGLGALFLAHGVAMALMVPLLWPILPRQVRQPFTIQPLKEHRVIYTTPRVAAPGTGFVFYTVTFIALLTFLPDAMDQPGLAQSLPLISLGGTFAAGWIARRTAPDLIGVAGYASSIACAALMGLGQDWAVFPLFFALGIVPGASFASIPHFNASAPDRARSSGAIAQLGNVGTASGTPIYAVLVAALGLPGLLVGIVLFGLLGIAGLLIMRRLILRQG